jgi:hypothetical protein
VLFERLVLLISVGTETFNWCYVEEGNFIRKLQKGSMKYKVKLLFKCFNCCKVGHFASKCPYPKEDPEDEENKNNQNKKKEKHNNKNFFYKGMM